MHHQFPTRRYNYLFEDGILVSQSNISRSGRLAGLANLKDTEHFIGQGKIYRILHKDMGHEVTNSKTLSWT